MFCHARVFLVCAVLLVYADEFSCRYNADKNILLEQIAMQKKRELERKNSKKERGELLMDIRAALQNMVAMLICVKRGNKIVARKPTEEFDKRFDIPMMEKMETEGDAKKTDKSCE